MDKCSYSPQISPITIPGLTPPAAVGPTLVKRDTVLLQYPYDSPTTTLTLRVPNLNNKLVPKISRIQTLSRGNTLVVYRDPIWPKSTILNWAFEGLTGDEAEACLAFSKLTCGKIIKLTDYESRVLRGILTNPRNPISQERNSCRGYTWKMDFQGAFV